MGQGFDQSAWAAQWSAILPALRRRIATFDIPADDVDDVLNETAERLFKAGYYHPKRSRFRRIAQGVAWRVARDIKRKRDAQLTTLYEVDWQTSALEVVDLPSSLEADSANEVDAWETRRSVPRVWARSSARNRDDMLELVRLVERGGPYDDQERQFMSRTRRRLSERFRECLGAVALVRPRWRWLRAEVLPTAGFAAGVVALTAGMVAIPAIVSRGAQAEPVVMRDARLPEPVELTAARLTTALPHQALSPAAMRPPASGHDGPEPGPPRRAPLEASVEARMPTPEQPGVVTVTVLSVGGTEARMDVHCDSGVRRLVCAAYGDGTDPSTTTSR